MDYLKSKSSMDNTRTWSEILDFVKDITPYITTGALMWKLIDKIASYYSAQQDNRLRDIVQDEMKPEINNLSKKIEALSEAIWELKKGLK